MESSPLSPSSVPAVEASTGAAATDVLRAIAAVAPQLWFPRRFAEVSGTSRDSLDEPLWRLRQAGMIHVADWIAGLGQGFQLTRTGEKAVEHPDLLSLADGAARMSESGEIVPERAAPVLRAAIVAPALLALNVVWFGVGAFLAWKAGAGAEYFKGESNPVSNQVLTRIGAVSGSHLLLGEWWRLLSSCFVHIGLLHLLGNMLMLGILGPVSEGLWGRGRFAVLYLASGLAGACAAMAVHPMADTASGLRESLLAGASGALWGVLMSVVVWLVRYRDDLPEGVAREWGRKLLFAVFLNLMLSFAPGISLEAHLGGGFAGAALAYWLDRRRAPNRWLGALGIAFALAAMIGGLYLTMRYSEEWKPLREVHAARLAFAELSKKTDGL